MPWIPSSVVEWFHISKDNVAKLSEENGILRTERDVLKQQITVAQSNFDWLKSRVNALEIERAQLIKKAYGIDVPAPEIVKQHDPRQILQMTSALFEDVGEEAARELGLPSYGSPSAKTN